MRGGLAAINRSVKPVTDQQRHRCTTKNHYDTWVDAEAACLLLIADLQDGKLKIQKEGTITAYRCRVCNRWAIGHQPVPRPAYGHGISRRKTRMRRMGL